VRFFADGQTVWRLGTVELGEVSGTWIGDLHVSSLSLRDSEGVWLTARDARLVWSPAALLQGRVVLEDVTVAAADVTRRPVLGPVPEQRGFKLRLEAPALSVNSLRLAEAVAGVTAQIQIAVSVASDADGLSALRFSAHRVDADTDNVLLSFQRGDIGAWALQANGAPGGVLAGLLDVLPDQAVALRGTAHGDAETGSAAAALAVGDQVAAFAQGAWGAGRWAGDGRLESGLIPILGLSQRLGGPAVFSGSGAFGGPVVARLAAPAVQIEMSGPLSGPLHVVADCRDAKALLDLPDAPLVGLHVDGTLTRAGEDFRFEGQAAASGVALGGFEGGARGAVTAALTRRAFQLEADAHFEGRGGLLGDGRAVPQRGAAALSYDRQAGRLRVERATLEAGAVTLSASGEGRRFMGEARASDLEALDPSLRGAARAEWTIEAVDGVWGLAARGAATRFQGPAALQDLLGRQPQFTAEGRFEDGGLRIIRSGINGPRLRLGASGLVSARTLDVVWEASARGPVAMAGLEAGGTIDARGRVTGAPAAPRVTGAASLARLDLGGAALTRATVRFAYADRGAALAVSGTYDDRPVSVIGYLVLLNEGVRLEGLEGDIGGLAVRGGMGVVGGRIDGVLDVDGPIDQWTDGAGALRGRVALSGAAEAPVLAADGVLRGARLGGVTVERAGWQVSGPLAALSLSAEGEGRAGSAPFQFTATGTARQGAGALLVDINAAGMLAGMSFQSLAPLRVETGRNGLMAQGDVRVGGGALRGAFSQRGETFEARARLEEMPISALAAISGERATGILNGEVSARSVGGRIEADGQMRAVGFRVRGRMNAPVDLSVDGGIAGETLTARLKATSPEGLSAEADLTVPVVTEAASLRVGPGPGAEGHATWSVTGPADAVWALTGAQDQSLSGTLSGRGEAVFAANALRGTGSLSLRQGTFEDRLSGALLRDIALDLAFQDDTVTVQALTAQDARGGQLTGSGVITGTRAGRLALHLNRLQLIGREDVTAAADGDLVFAWTADDASLTGDLLVRDATIRAAPAAGADIPYLEVVEINRPEAIAPVGLAANRRAGPSARLDLRVRAPGRVFTRYRGFSAEWSLDLRAQGTSSAPLLYGEATLLRGDAQLAGRAVDITRGTVQFRGAPEDAALDVVAEQTSSSLTARMILAGTVGRPEIRFENDSGLPEDEVLPQLLFGASQQELSPLQAAQLAASLSALAGGSAFDIADLARRIVGLDRFDVRQEADGILVAGGRYLTRDVYVELARNGLGEAQTRVEWHVGPRLTLVTSFAQTGEQSASLRWRTEDEIGRD